MSSMRRNLFISLIGIILALVTMCSNPFLHVNKDNAPNYDDLITDNDDTEVPDTYQPQGPTPISSATVSVTAPAKGETPVVTAASDDEGYVCGKVTWSPAHNIFQGNTKYTATLTLTADANYFFAEGFTATINGVDAEVESQTDEEATITLQFDATLDKVVIGISIKTQPAETTYTHGDTLDLDGLVVTLTFDDGASEDFELAHFGTTISTVPVNGATLSHTNHDGKPVVVHYGGESANTDNLAVNKKALTVTGAVHTKEYDGDTSANGVTITLAGIAGSDNVLADTVIAEYTASAVGTTTLSITDITLTGADAGNYMVTLPANNITVDGIIIANITWLDLTANGTAYTVTTTELTLAFDKDPIGLVIENVSVTGATKGTLTVNGAIRTLTISNIVVTQGADITVELTNPTGYMITPSSKTVAINSDPVIVSTFAGSTLGNADGTGTAAQFSHPNGVAVDNTGNVYVADYSNNRIRKITPAGVVTTFAGSTQGNADGIGTAAQFYRPSGVAVDTAGNVYVADYGNNRIRKITPAGVVTTLAGSTQGNADGIGTAAQFSNPAGVAVDTAGNVYVSDMDNNRIKKITPEWDPVTLSYIVVVTTFVGSTQGYADGTGTAALFNHPLGIDVDSIGNVYVADANNHRIRKITPAGDVTTLAGSTQGYANGTGTAAQFYSPFDVTVDNEGNVYVADSENNRIRKITPAGDVTTLAGSYNGYADGAGATARFSNPSGVAVIARNIYVGDRNNWLIRKISF